MSRIHSLTKREMLNVFSGILLALAVAGRASAAFPTTVISAPRHPMGLQTFIMRAYRAGRGQCIIPPGIYNLPRPHGEFYLSFSSMKNFRIVGKGVTLIRADLDKGGIKFDHCRNITLDGVTLRCNPIPYAQGRIIAINHKKHCLTILICKGYASDLSNPMQFNRRPLGTVFSPATLRIKPGTMDIFYGKLTKIGPREYRCARVRSLMPLNIGDLVTFRSHLHDDVAVDDCSNMCISHVTVMAGTGFCFHEQGGGGGNRYINDSVVYPPDPRGATVRPLQASNADGLHSNLMRHGPIIIGCHFEGTGDDGIAIHGWYAMLRRVVGRQWTVLFPYGSKNFFRAGDKLRLYSPNGSYLGRTRVVSVKPLAGYKPARPTALKRENPGSFSGPSLWSYTVTVSHSISHSGFQDRICDTNANGSGFVIRNCVIRNNRARGMIIKADNGIIENNTVEGSSVGGIEVAPSFWWDESGCGCHLLIEGNTIRHVGYATANPLAWFQAGAVSIVAHTDAAAASFGHNGIVVMANRFIDDNRINLLFSDTRNAIIADNTFTRPMCKADSRVGLFHYDFSSLVWLQQCKTILLAGNRVVDPGKGMKQLVGVGPNVSNISGIKNGVVITVAAKRRSNQSN